MERNANYAVVGFASLILFIGLAAFVMWLARVQFARDYALYDILFQGPVRGISEGGEVHFNGIKVGEVTKIALDPTNTARVIARVRVTSEVPIRTDSYATLEPQGITGVNYIQITAGTSGKPLLADVTPRGEVPKIRSQKGALADLLEGGGTVLQQSVEALNRVNRLLSDQNIKEVSGAIQDAHAMTSELRKRDAMIAEAQHTIQSIDQTAQKIGQLTESSNKLVNGEGRETLQNLNKAAQQVAQAAADTRAIVAQLKGPTTDFANNGMPQLSSAIAGLHSATDSLNRVVSEAEQSPQGFLAKAPAKEKEVRR